MKILIDNNLSPLLAEGLRAAGHDAVHLRDIAMRDAPDPAVPEYARSEECVLISADTDFGALLAPVARNPAVDHFDSPANRVSCHRAVRHHPGQPPQVAEGLVAGAVVVLGDDWIRIRRLPMPG